MKSWLFMQIYEKYWLIKQMSNYIQQFLVLREIAQPFNLVIWLSSTLIPLIVLAFFTWSSEACSEPCQTYKMKRFTKKVNGFYALKGTWNQI